MNRFLLWLLFVLGCPRMSRGASAPWPEQAPRLPTSTPPQIPPAPEPRWLPTLPTGEPVVAPATPPWPQVIPSTLPAFPGAAWEYDEPPPAAVQQRASQLRAQLWAAGAGSHRIEQTAGRWIAYRAEKVRSGNQGVVAYRLKSEHLPASVVLTKLPQPTPTTTRSSPPSSSVPSSSPPAVVLPTAPAPAARSVTSLPDLKIGDGLKPKAPVPEVVLVQQKLAVSPADGRFGKATQDAVIKFQVRTGLAPNLPIEQLRARGFGAVKRATWTKLFEVRV